MPEDSGNWSFFMSYLQRTVIIKQLERHSVRSGSTSAGKVLNDFANNTSLLGIQHFLRTKSFVWLLAYLGCVAMSIIQSWSVTVKFFEQNTYQSITISSKTLMPFPSVTVCTGTLLRKDFNFSSIPDFNVTMYKRILEQCDDAEAMREMAPILVSNRRAVRRFMRTLSEERRLTLGLNLTRVLKDCKLGTLRCDISDSRDFHIYSNPYYGSCFTFNPAFTEDSTTLVHQNDHLRMTFQFPSEGYWLAKRSNPKMAVHIHSPGTAPLIEDPEVIDVFAEEIAIIAVTLESEMLSVKKRLTKIPSCVDSDDETYRRRSMYYTKRSPYVYSQEACLASCTQERYGRCGAIVPQAPALSKEYQRGKIITAYPECDMDPVNMVACDCPIPCNRLQYRFVRDTNDIYSIPCKKEKVLASNLDTKPQKDNETDKDEYEARIVVRFRSNIYQMIEEKLSCGVSEFLGILGGNVGLWIGLCIISLLEVIELIIKLTVTALKSQRKK